MVTVMRASIVSITGRVCHIDGDFVAGGGLAVQFSLGLQLAGVGVDGEQCIGFGMLSVSGRRQQRYWLPLSQ